jgi:hypothetical protein
MADLMEPIKIGVLQYLLPDSVADAALPRRTDVTYNSTMFVRPFSSPFAEGEIRLAYHGRLARKQEALDTGKSAVVMKTFKCIGKGVNGRDQYFKQMEVSTSAHFLATEFNKLAASPPHCGAVHVLQARVVEEE